MNYENFEKAKSLVEQIDKCKTLLNELIDNNISVKIMSAQFTVMTIGTSESCEHDCSKIANSFILSLVEFYNEKKKSLLAELSTL